MRFLIENIIPLIISYLFLITYSCEAAYYEYKTETEGCTRGSRASKSEKVADVDYRISGSIMAWFGKGIDTVIVLCSVSGISGSERTVLACTIWTERLAEMLRKVSLRLLRGMLIYA